MTDPHQEQTPPAREPRSGGLGRRDLLMLGAGLVAGAGAGVGGWVLFGKDGLARADSGSEPLALRRFASTDLACPQVSTWTAPGTEPAPGLLFTTPRTTVFHGLVFDDAGEPVWIEPDGQTVADLRVQRYRGRNVLTYWTGEVADGTGIGAGKILDERYLPIATVRCGNGAFADLHEFRLTERGTALLLAYPVEPRDLTSIGGPEDGYVHNCRVQEVDVATGEVLLDWAVLDHLDLSETYKDVDDDGGSPQKAFDPVHVNSVDERGDDLLLSARHTSALYLIDRRTGELRWRFGGRKSDFEIPEEGRFEAQHDARFHPDGTMTIYDNHGLDDKAGRESAGLEFVLDETELTCTLTRALRHAGHYGYAMGNAERLPGGNTLIGWGTAPAVTEFDGDGQVVFEARGLGEGTYRGYRAEWTGRPVTEPDIGVTESGSRLEVHASWNGATEVSDWRVLAGARPGALQPTATARRTGFETSVAVRRARHVAVEALDADGAVLGRSRVLTV